LYEPESASYNKDGIIYGLRSYNITKDEKNRQSSANETDAQNSEDEKEEEEDQNEREDSFDNKYKMLQLLDATLTIQRWWKVRKELKYISSKYATASLRQIYEILNKVCFLKVLEIKKNGFQ